MHRIKTVTTPFFIKHIRLISCGIAVLVSLAAVSAVAALLPSPIPAREPVALQFPDISDSPLPRIEVVAARMTEAQKARHDAQERAVRASSLQQTGR